MKSPTLGARAAQILAVALCAWGIVAILNIVALAATLALGGAAPTGSGSPPTSLLLGTWIVLSVQLFRALAPDGTGEGGWL